jgi:glycosyltransferase involved in cell wall biosynthesis
MMTTARRVLITNYSLEERAGTQLFVRDLAIALLRRGHLPVVYSPAHGAVARELRAATVPVTDDLGKLTARPDIIHAQHHLEAMTALLRFRDVPAIYYCHGWLPRVEAPPAFPRVLRYVAVDDTCRDRLVCEHGVPEDRARVILNSVDLKKFRARRAPLPSRPQRALVFSNFAEESGYVAAVREACARYGIKLDVVGARAGGATDEPEKLLPRYDLVFAKARCALEALACGASVVLCDKVGAGEMVTTAELERLRRLNFGVRALNEVLSAEHLAREIARYDATDATDVSRRVRASADQESAVEEISALYEEVIAEYKTYARDDDAVARRLRDEAEELAAAEYLRRLSLEVRRESDLLYNSRLGRLHRTLLRVPLVGSLAAWRRGEGGRGAR